MYLTFSDYQSMGGTLDESGFSRYSPLAEATIDHYTFNRLKKDFSTEEQYVNIPANIKSCMFAIIDFIVHKDEILKAKDTSGEEVANIQKESNDGVSVTYNILSARQVLTLSKGEVKSLITMYLDDIRNSEGKRVLYRGLYPGE